MDPPLEQGEATIWGEHIGVLDSGGGGEKKKKKKGVGSATEPNDSGLASKGIPIDKTTKVAACFSNTNAHSSTPNAMLNTPVSGLVDAHKSTGGPNSTTPVPHGIPDVINTGPIPYVNIVNSVITSHKKNGSEHCYKRFH
uniref:Uncharacterized protein n=1 Tax=Tanacetum cinerariifolium TaxID=118510 RepID=A0A699GTJ9_TANCI|nr:hypothetical protein [Tanacetum cinerariifolium]